MNARDAVTILDQVGAVGSRLDKIDLLKLHTADPFMKKVLRYAYDPFITFGIKPARYQNPPAAGETFDENSKIWLMLDALANRTLTGTMAAMTVDKVFGMLDVPSASLLYLIINKDLRCGITEKTINLVEPGLVPVFDVMLAHKYEPHRIKSFPVPVEPKLDGVRVICLVRDNRARFFSRSGKPFPAVEHLEAAVLDMLKEAARQAFALSAETPQFLELIGDVANPSIVLDGEITGPGHFNESSGAVRRKSEAATDAIFTVFEALPYEGFADPAESMPALGYERRENVEFIIGAQNKVDGPIRLIDRWMCLSHTEIEERFEQVRATGGEGIIVKPVNARYEKKRSYAWLKVKAEQSEDLRIVGAYEGEAGTKLEGSLGGLVVERPSDGQIVYVSVGGGFKEHERDPLWASWLKDAAAAGVEWDRADKYFWKNQTHTPKGEEIIPLLRAVFGAGELLGRLIEVEFHEVTPDGSLRHPRFLRCRDDKDVAAAA